MKSRNPPPVEPTEEEIRHAAYFLWEQEGRPEGRDWEIWLAARERLRHTAPAPHGGTRRPKAAPTPARDAQSPDRKCR